MFERFTSTARRVVVAAQEHAAQEDAPAVTEEHMLLALLDQRDTAVAGVFTALGVDRRRDAVVRGLAEARRRGGLSEADAEALAGLGIDVTEVVARVEAVHGRGAMGPGAVSRRGGRRPFSDGAKRTLEKSLRVAVGRKDRHIGDEHLLLALTIRPGVVHEVLAAHGVTHESVVRALPGSASDAA